MQGQRGMRQVRVDSALLSPLMARTALCAAYCTLVIGYLISVLSVARMTSGDFLFFTGLQVVYSVVFWWVGRRKRRLFWWGLCEGGALLLLTYTIGSVSVRSFTFDWLLYFATVGAYFIAFSLRGAIVASLLLYLAAGLNIGFSNQQTGFPTGLLSLLAGFVFVAVFVVGVKVLNTQREQSELLVRRLEESTREQEEASEQLRRYADEVEELTIDRERTRMAREIHDTLGHYLTILAIQLETIGKLQERDPARAMVEVAEARRVVAQSLQEVRNAVAALRSPSIATLGLKEAIAQLGFEFGRGTDGVELTLDLDTELPLLAVDMQMALYRAAQEALTNVRKHARATKVLLRVRYEHGWVEMVVLDNGRGSSDEGRMVDKGGFGLIGLRERIELLGGSVVHGREASGYRVTVCVPVSEQGSDVDGRVCEVKEGKE